MQSKADSRMRNGFQEAMMKMAIEDKDKIEITKEHLMYINAQCTLGTDFAILGRTLNSPGDWWAGYGYEIPTLQRAAIRILSQPCSSHWCRWNWNTFDAVVYTKKSNTGDLLFVHCNIWLQEIVKGMDGKHKPIFYDDVDASAVWATKSEPSPALTINSWLDDVPP